MKRFVLSLAVAGAALLAPGLALAQEKPVLNSAPPAPAPVAPAPAVVTPAPVEPAAAPTDVVAPTAPGTALPPPTYASPSGFDLPEREQKRKAAQEHADMYTKLFLYGSFSPGYVNDVNYGYSQLSLSISPALGYRLNDRVSVGPGISYTYNNYGFATGPTTTKHISTNTLGIKGFAQVMVYKSFFVHGEYEVTKAEIPVQDANYNITTASYQVTSPLAGVGYRSQFSSRVAGDIVVLYNFSDTYNSIYHNPVVRFNFLVNIGK